MRVFAFHIESAKMQEYTVEEPRLSGLVGTTQNSPDNRKYDY